MNEQTFSYQPGVYGLACPVATADEIMQILEGVDSSYFGVNFDTGNFLRLLDDPIEGMRKLAPYVMATHTKDLMVDTSVSPSEWHFFAGVSVGMRLRRLMGVAEQILAS